MKTVNIHEAKSKLSSLIGLVEKENEHFLVCRAGKPIAEIIPYTKKKRSELHGELIVKKVDADLTLPISEDWDV